MPTQIYYSDSYHPDDYHSEAQASYGHGNNSDSYGYCPIYRDTIHSSDKVDGNGDVSNMSFTGIVITDDAMIAFGDSKGTRRDAFGNMMQERGRQVRKVFRFDENTLIAASGINMVHDKGIIRCVENVIEESINDEHTDILMMLERLSRGLKDINGECHIYIGRKEGAGIASVQEVFINSSCVQFFQRKYNNEEAFTKLMNNTPVFAFHLDETLALFAHRHTDYTTEDIMKLIEDCIRADIERVEKEYDYCPVGLPVQFEVIELS